MGTLINGIKEIFASASQTSPTNIPTCAADGTPNGNITIANLASVLGVIGHGYPYSIISSVGANQQAFIGTLKEETPYVVIIKNSGYTGILSIFYIRNSLVAKKCLLEYDGANFADAIVCPVYNTTTADIYFKPTENRTNVYYKVIEL